MSCLPNQRPPLLFYYYRSSRNVRFYAASHQYHNIAEVNVIVQLLDHSLERVDAGVVGTSNDYSRNEHSIAGVWFLTDLS